MKLLKGYRKYLYERDTVFATIGVFIVIGLLALLPLNTKLLNPVKKAFSDFDFNDIAYAKVGKKADSLDQRIVIVNIGMADRAILAALIEKVSSLKPKVIALDVTLDGEKEPESDSLLRNVIKSTPNLVLAMRLNWENKQPIDKGYFARDGKSFGYVNFIGEDRGTIRTYSPVEYHNGKEYLAFSTAILKVADPQAYNKLRSRNKEYETINYKRRLEKYVWVEGSELLMGNLETNFRDKIVLLGYLNTLPNDIEDKHFTPMNTKAVGKPLPDMSGIVIHANILSMVIDKKYVHSTPLWVNWIITILIAWLHVSLFIRYYIDTHIWFHLVAKTAQIISAIFFVFLSIQCLNWFSLKIDMKMPVTVIILAIDVIYFYEAFAVWLHEKYGFKTIFHHKH